MLIQWEHDKNHNVHYCRIGARKLTVGSVVWHWGTVGGRRGGYSPVIRLPGMRQTDTLYPTVDAAKVRLEKQIATWFEWSAEE